MVAVVSENHKKTASSLVLGSVQFGLPYGVANSLGKPDTGRVREILDLARDSGIRMLDTAAVYGESEAVLGACGVSGWSVVTKVPSLCDVDEAAIGRKARESVLRSLELLRTENLYAVLAHDSRDMIGTRGRHLHAALETMQAEGLIVRIGMSVYAPQDMEGVSAERAQVVQAPFNVFDQRFVRSGAAATLRRNGGELHVRSVFLQGLLLMPVTDRPARFAPWAAILECYDARVRDSGLDPAAFCLGFAARQADVAHCVVGVDSPQQLSELVTAFTAGGAVDPEANDLASDELQLIDPQFWKDQK